MGPGVGGRETVALVVGLTVEAGRRGVGGREQGLRLDEGALEKLRECTVRAWRGGTAVEQKDSDKSDW